jgi:hypothetical protein
MTDRDAAYKELEQTIKKVLESSVVIRWFVDADKLAAKIVASIEGWLG